MNNSKLAILGPMGRFGTQVIAAIALAFSAIVITGTVMASPASAACPGSLVYRDANSVGELVVYYSTAASGTNCAQTNHLGSAYGVASDTLVVIYRCSQASPSNTCTVTGGGSPDQANYAYYAGPVSVTGTVNRCVRAIGGIVSGGNSYIYETSPKATACG